MCGSQRLRREPSGPELDDAKDLAQAGTQWTRATTTPWSEKEPCARRASEWLLRVTVGGGKSSVHWATLSFLVTENDNSC